MFAEPAFAGSGIRLAVPTPHHHRLALDRAGHGDAVLHNRIILALDLHRAADPEIVLAAHVALENAAPRGLSFDVEIKLDLRPLVAGELPLNLPWIRSAWLVRRTRRARNRRRTSGQSDERQRFCKLVHRPPAQLTRFGGPQSKHLGR